MGYRNMKVYLERKGVVLSHVTVHKYMNKELGLVSIVRRKKPTYERGGAHKKFDNLINQNFAASRINQKLANDFTYLFLSGGDVRYNCTIIDLYDRSVAASITDRHNNKQSCHPDSAKSFGQSEVYQQRYYFA